MNIDYLYSIMNLYFKKENNIDKACMKIVKKNDNLEFNFNMNSNDPNKTCFFFPEDLFEENMNNILGFFKDNSVLIDEKYNYDKEKDCCNYNVEFQNGRKITFDGFSVKYISDIRNSIYNKTLNTNEIDAKFDEEFNYNLNNKFTPAYTGFASFKSILLISLFFLIVLVISLIYFI